MGEYEMLEEELTSWTFKSAITIAVIESSNNALDILRVRLFWTIACVGPLAYIYGGTVRPAIPSVLWTILGYLQSPERPA